MIIMAPRASRTQSWCWLLAAGLIAGLAAPVQAEPPNGQYYYSLRAGFGGGIANGGIAVRLGLATEYWLNAHFGLGATATASYKVAFGGDLKARSAAVLAAVRSAPWRHCWIFGAGVGLASADYSPTDQECPAADSSCPRHGAVLAVPIVLGWLSHPGRLAFEWGPVVRLDIFADPRGRIPAQYLFTINLELGFALFNG